MLQTSNYNLNKPEGNDVVDISVLNQNFDVIDTTMKNLNDRTSPYIVSSGSANVYTATINGITSYTAGMRICVQINVTSTGASTININGLGAKTILDSFGNAISNGGLKANIPYQLCYNGSNFIVLGKGGGGDATADQVLNGKKVTVDSGQIVGIMPNNNIPSTNLQINGTYTIPKGYHPGTEIVTQNIPTKAEATIMPATTDQIIPANIYTTGIQTILGDANLIPESILSGRSIFNVTGTAILAYSTNGNFTTNVQSVGTEISVITLGFIPDFVTVWNNAGNHRSIYVSQNFQGTTYASLPIYLYGNELNGGFSFTHDINSVSFGIKVTGSVLTFKCPYINSQTYYWFAGKLVS